MTGSRLPVRSDGGDALTDDNAHMLPAAAPRPRTRR